ncbi:MAG: formate dehydrogenase subunit gamma [Geminicoccaceae bacterium]|nr:formate dehydrogenase subunit gamma [Geminicoccaceae bacterium]
MQRHALLVAALVLLLTTADGAWAQSSSVRPPEGASQSAAPPSINILPQDSSSDIWRQIRRGETGASAMPTPAGGQLIQSEGENWREFRNGAYYDYAVLFLLGTLALLALFFTIRGRVRIRGGKAGIEIRRFAALERFVHWFTAICFLVLALTGLNLIFGRPLLLPLLGKEVFATWSMWGKLTHNSIGFGFMIGVVAMFLLWVWHNLPHPRDLVWLAKGGGIIGNAHVPSTKFNTGQKLIFWAVILGGASLSVSGFALLRPPYDLGLFAATFGWINDLFGTDLPTVLDTTQEMQLNQIWHGAVGVVMTAIIFGHIYIGTIGMEGAFAAMGRGRVDLNWAREHHDLWVERLEKEGRLSTVPEAAPEVARGVQAPAE